MYLFLMGSSVNPPVGRTLVDMLCLPVFLMQKPADPAINKTGC